MSGKLTRIDATLLEQHSKLCSDDECYFWKEYTSGRGYAFGPGNDLISNLKKKPSQSSSGEIFHKNRVIRECSAFFQMAINPGWIADATLVPIPGSKAIGHPDFDDRMTRVMQGIVSVTGLDIRSLIKLTESIDASHEMGPGQRHTVDDLLAVYAIDEALSGPPPKKIGLFDDVITAGVHYRACHTLLRSRFPNTPIVGFFVARRVFPEDQ